MLIEAIARPLRVRLPDRVLRLEPGTPVEMPDLQAAKLLRKARGKVRRLPEGACYACGSTRWWLSIHHAIVCPVCHPPAAPDLVIEWIEGTP